MVKTRAKSGFLILLLIFLTFIFQFMTGPDTWKSLMQVIASAVWGS
jgi:hypothetical protein